MPALSFNAVIDGVHQGEQFDRPVAVAEQRKRQRAPHCRMGVLAAVLAQPGRVGLDVAGIVRRAVERRGEQLHQTIAAAHELCVHRMPSPAPRDQAARRRKSPPRTLSHRIDPAFIAPTRIPRRAVVVVPAPIPIAVPGLAFDGLLQNCGVLAPARRLVYSPRAPRRWAQSAVKVACRNQPSQTLSPRPWMPTRFMPSFQSPVPNSGRPCAPTLKLESSARTQ